MTVTEELAAAPPKGWSLVPLWSIAKRRDVTNRPTAELLSVYRDHGVVPKSSRDDNFNKPSDDLTSYRWVQRGDLVLNKMKTWQGSLAVSQHEGIVSPAYYVCRLSESVSGRFIHYLLRSARYIALYGALSKGIRPNQWDLPYEEFRDIPVLLPPLPEQRRIADFLDDQVTCIDQAIQLRKRQAELLEAQEQAALDAEIERQMESYGTMPLRRWIRSIEQGWSPLCSNEPAADQEFGVLKLSAVRAGRFFPQRNKEMLAGAVPQTRYALRSGDLLISRANTPDLVGEAAVVDRDYPNRFLCDLLYRVSLSIGEPAYVAASLRSSRTRGLLRVLARGTSQTMAKIRGDDIRDLTIAAVDQQTRSATAREVATRMAFTDQARVTVHSSVELLGERKRSLITAAVTGEFDVSSASVRASEVATRS